MRYRFHARFALCAFILTRLLLFLNFTVYIWEKIKCIFKKYTIKNDIIASPFYNVLLRGE